MFRMARRCLPALFLTSTALAEPIALENFNYVDTRNLAVVPGQTLVIDGDRILEVGPAKKVKAPKEARRVDLSGKFVIPGLIDGHVHHATDPDGWDRDNETLKRLAALLQGGVTGVRDMGGDARALAKLKRDAELDVIASPDIYYSVIIAGEEFFSDPRTVSSAKGRLPGQTDWMRAVDADSNTDEVVLRAAGTGATGLKIYANVDAGTVGRLAASASKYGVETWGHAFVSPARPAELSAAGVQTLSHASDLAAHVIDDFWKFRRERKPLDQAIIDTAFELDRYGDLFDTLVANGTFIDATLTAFLPGPDPRPNEDVIYEMGKAMARAAHEAGVRFAAGTDAFSDLERDRTPMLHTELALLVEQAGLSPLEALQAATWHNAHVIGMEHELGSLEAGRKANLVVLDANPAENITHTAAIAHVLKNGRFVFRGDMPQLPFSTARADGHTLWLSGQIGNFPGTMVLASDGIEGQMRQIMSNIRQVLQQYQLTFDDIHKCTLMLENIDDWATASQIYVEAFPGQKPARSAFATNGLALGALAELECIASL